MHITYIDLVQPKDTISSNLPWEPVSGNAPSKPSVISGEHDLRILVETFDTGGDHCVLRNHVLCAKNDCKWLSSREVKRQSYYHQSGMFSNINGLMTILSSVLKLVYGGWHLRRGREYFVVFVRSI